MQIWFVNHPTAYRWNGTLTLLCVCFTWYFDQNQLEIFWGRYTYDFNCSLQLAYEFWLEDEINRLSEKAFGFVSVLGRNKHLDCVKRIWYLSPMRAAKVLARLRIRAVSPEPSLLAHTSSESRGTFRQKARFLAPLNGWACAVEICHDGMLEDTKSLDGAHFINTTVQHGWHRGDRL